MIIDGKAAAKVVQDELKSKVYSFKKRKPCLAVVLVGSDPASHIYVNHKTKACQAVGILSIKKELSSDIPEKALLDQIMELNQDCSVDGILVQLPLPDHINPLTVISSIDPEKDVDGFHPVNMGKLLSGDPTGFVPCTPLGIYTLLAKENIPIAGSHTVILGRSNIVGKPMAALLMQRGIDATVTVAHSKTKNLEDICCQADILIAAIGKPEFVTRKMVKKDAVVIDVGINRVEAPETSKGYKLVGDVSFNDVHSQVKAITPVPGGIGPMTIAMLLTNTIKSFEQCKK